MNGFSLVFPWGADAPSGLERTNGLVSFDPVRKRLSLASDPLGASPLFYCSGKNAFFCSDSLNELASEADFPLEISPSSLRMFMEFQYVPVPRTIYRNVFRVPPGHVLEADLNSRSTTLRRVWRFDMERKTDMSYPEACAALRRIMTDVVERSVPADKPTGVLLSGGLDSAVVAALVARKTEYPLTCVTIAFDDDPRYDERARAEKTFHRLEQDAARGAVHYCESFKPDDFELLPILAEKAGQPYADASMLPTCLAARLMKRHVDVAFCGDAADEMYGGYERYQAMRLLRSTRFLPRAFWSAAAKFAPDSGERAFLGRLRRFLRLAACPESVRYRALTTHFASDVLARIAPDLPDFEWIPESRLSDCAERCNEWDVRTYLPGDALPKMRLCAEEASLDVVSPFADMKSVEFAASLPFRFKQLGRVRKRIVIDAFRDLLPGSALGKKQGFGVPLARLFRTDWKSLVFERVMDDSLSTWFDRDGRERLLTEHARGEKDWSYPLFSLTMLSFWLSMRKNQPLLLQKRKKIVN